MIVSYAFGGALECGANSRRLKVNQNVLFERGQVAAPRLTSGSSWGFWHVFEKLRLQLPSNTILTIDGMQLTFLSAISQSGETYATTGDSDRTSSQSASWQNLR